MSTGDDSSSDGVQTVARTRPRLVRVSSSMPTLRRFQVELPAAPRDMTSSLRDCVCTEQQPTVEGATVGGACWTLNSLGL